MKRGLAALAVVVAAAAGAAGCTRPPRGPSAKAVAEGRARTRAPAPPGEWFWEPVDSETHAPARKPTELPLAEGALPARLEGAEKVWDELGADARERIRRDGVLVLAEDATLGGGAQTIGAFYSSLRDQRVPIVVTLDALFGVVQLAVERALAEAEEVDLAPALVGWLEKVDARLAKDDASGTELAEAMRVARAVIAVARTLADPKLAPNLDKDLTAAVNDERAAIESAAASATSPVLGVPIDYTQFVVPSASARPGLYRALAWLGAAPFALVGRGEIDGARVDVSRARKHARAAMFLARACDRDVDAALAASYAHLTRLLTFVWGAPDDLSLVELDDLASAAGVDLTKPGAMRSVVAVDRVRARARAGRGPAIYDGAAAVGRGGLGVRIFGGHASADSLVLESLLGSAVGPAQKITPPPAATVRNHRRVMPVALDLAAWLGTPEARTLLRESHADAFERYDAALLGLQRTRPTTHAEAASPLHASVYGSLVDALIAWGAAGEADPVAAPASPPLARRRVESLLVAWTRLRHSGQPFARARPAAAWEPPPVKSPTRTPVLVEALPDVIRRLVATIRQVRRGLDRIARNAASGPALAEVEEILRVALKGAERAASDDPPTAEEATALAALPHRIARLEQDATETEVGPSAAVVFSDPASKRVLVSATGRLEPALLLLREPGTTRDEPLLVVGAHFGHHELVETLDPKKKPAITDAAWRARLKGANPAAWTASFRGLR